MSGKTVAAVGIVICVIAGAWVGVGMVPEERLPLLKRSLVIH